jgi:hypothetical protein
MFFRMFISGFLDLSYVRSWPRLCKNAQSIHFGGSFYHCHPFENAVAVVLNGRACQEFRLVQRFYTAWADSGSSPITVYLSRTADREPRSAVLVLVQSR